MPLGTSRTPTTEEEESGGPGQAQQKWGFKTASSIVVGIPLPVYSAAVIRLSVIITVFNGREFLREAVMSVLAEDCPGVEIVVVDDGSTDGSLDCVKDLPVHAVRLGENRGFPAALNAGLAAAGGTYVTFLDCDDRMAPGGIRWRLDWIARNPELPALAGRPARIIDSQGETLPQFRHVLREGFVPPEKLTLSFFQNGGLYPVPIWNYLLHRSLIAQVGKFDESLKIACDFQYLLRVLALTEIPVVFNPVVERRLHGKNLSLCLSEGDYQLKPETIAECLRILAPFGVQPSEWPLWEKGFV